MVVYDNTAILYRRLSNQTQIASLQCFWRIQLGVSLWAHRRCHR